MQYREKSMAGHWLGKVFNSNYSTAYTGSFMQN